MHILYGSAKQNVAQPLENGKLARVSGHLISMALR